MTILTTTLIKVVIAIGISLLGISIIVFNYYRKKK